MTLDISTDIRRALYEAATRRQGQLDELPAPDGDHVVQAQRASIERILTEIRSAQNRLEGGTYGACQRCGASIPEARLQLLPWTAHCVPCAH